ncbi:MAG: hypothetical protein QFE16_16915 [Pseudomonadota bacterium]|nr:hypothetical protein [Pseudomonadota bacterium]
MPVPPNGKPGGLDPVQQAVGARQQFAQASIGTGHDGHSDACADPHASTVDIEGLAGRSQHLVGQCLGGFDVALAAQKNGEFVTAEKRIAHPATSLVAQGLPAATSGRLASNLLV